MSKQKSLYTTCSELIFFREFNEQPVFILWVNWCKNEGFWKRFTCTTTHCDILMHDNWQIFSSVACLWADWKCWKTPKNYHQSFLVLMVPSSKILQNNDRNSERIPVEKSAGFILYLIEWECSFIKCAINNYELSSDKNWS